MPPSISATENVKNTILSSIMEYSGILLMFILFINHDAANPAPAPIIAPEANCCTSTFNESCTRNLASTSAVPSPHRLTAS